MRSPLFCFVIALSVCLFLPAGWGSAKEVGPKTLLWASSSEVAQPISRLLKEQEQRDKSWVYRTLRFLVSPLGKSIIMGVIATLVSSLLFRRERPTINLPEDAPYRIVAAPPALPEAAPYRIVAAPAPTTPGTESPPPRPHIDNPGDELDRAGWHVKGSAFGSGWYGIASREGTFLTAFGATKKEALQDLHEQARLRGLLTPKLPWHSEE